MRDTAQFQYRNSIASFVDLRYQLWCPVCYELLSALNLVPCHWQ
jgi:hypothetical protein